MDEILKALQNKAFHLSDATFGFLAGKYEELIGFTIPEVRVDAIHPDTVREIIRLHRAQFLSAEYLQSRISNPTTGTIDHLHAEITAATAVRLGMKLRISGYAIELVRTAGHLHDSDRSFPHKMTMGEVEARHDPETYREHKKEHARNSSLRAQELLDQASRNGCYFPVGFANDLRYLILRHELGGEKQDGMNQLKQSEIEQPLNLNDLADVVTDADSLAYFDANILTNWEECNRDKTALANKVHFMYDRMTLKAQDELRDSIVFSEDHILGSPSDDDDIGPIREILLGICG